MKVKRNMGTIKDMNGMHLTEAEDNKKRWQEYTDISGNPSAKIGEGNGNPL